MTVFDRKIGELNDNDSEYVLETGETCNREQAPTVAEGDSF